MLFARHSNKKRGLDMLNIPVRWLQLMWYVAAIYRVKEPNPPRLWMPRANLQKGSSGSVGFNKHRNWWKNTTVSIMWSLMNPPESWFFWLNILEEAKHWYLATFLYLVPRSTGHLVNGQAMRFATLCSLCLICSATNRDMSKGFPYPPDTRPEGCRKYKRRSWVGRRVGGVYEGHIFEEWMNFILKIDVDSTF